MSNDREVITQSGQTVTLTEEQKAKEYEGKRARFARVLERGFLVDRLTVENLPPNLYGEWVPRDVMELERKKALGFWIDEEYAPKRALHSDGSTQAIVGDCVFMVQQMEDHELLMELRTEMYNRTHGSKKEQKEERDFKTQAEHTGVPIIEESVADAARVVRKAELAQASKT